MNPESYPNLDSFLIHFNFEIHNFPRRLWEVWEEKKVINSRCWNVEHITLINRGMLKSMMWCGSNGLSQNVIPFDK